MSPIFENLKFNLGRQEKEKYSLASILVAFCLPIIFLYLFGATMDENGPGREDDFISMPFFYLVFLSIPTGIYIGATNTFGKIAQKSFFLLFDERYNLIESRTKKIFNKKTLKAKEIDKLVKSLVTEYLDYENVLDIIGYTDDTLNHAINLKKKVKKPLPVGSAKTKAGETLFYRTHATWSQGAIEGSTLKDIGFFYFSNKRFIFNGSEKSCSINLTRITKVSIGPNYIYLQKTAGQNDIFEIENENSIEYLRFLYNKLG